MYANSLKYVLRELKVKQTCFVTLV